MHLVIGSQLLITPHSKLAPDNRHRSYHALDHQELAPDNQHRSYCAPDYQEPAPDDANVMGYQEPALQLLVRNLLGGAMSHHGVILSTFLDRLRKSFYQTGAPDILDRS